jgi:hypothetical protein
MMKSLGCQITRRHSLKLVAGAISAALAPGGRLAAEGSRPIRLAISTDTLAGANVADARAAYLVWLREVTTQYGVQTAVVVPEVFISPQELYRDVKQSSIDAYGVTALELGKLEDLTDPESIVLQDYLVEGMEYVVLVHGQSRFRSIADLQGSRIVLHLHRDMVLFPAWLSTMLAANNLPLPERFFTAQTLNDKVNQVVLPVFFRRMDAAGLARRDWETAVELNPQLGRELRPLAVSPKVIPILLAFRRGTSPVARKALIDSIQKISTFTAGQQIVALYQSRAFTIRPLSVMKSTLDMVRQFERLSGQKKGQI